MLAELNIIGIIIAIVVAIIASIVKKKQGNGEEEWELPPELKPKRDRPQPPPAASRWEEELRRVLEQQRPAPPPIAPPAPPPLIVRHQPPPVAQIEEYQPSDEGPTYQESASARLHTLSEANQRHAHAASLFERTQEQLHELHTATHRATGPATVKHLQHSAEVQALLQSLRQPQGARTAILASVILGPPRALEAQP
jgi:hypothetical protein